MSIIKLLLKKCFRHYSGPSMYLSKRTNWSFPHWISKILFVIVSCDGFGSQESKIGTGVFLNYLNFWNNTFIWIRMEYSIFYFVLFLSNIRCKELKWNFQYFCLKTSNFLNLGYDGVPIDAMQALDINESQYGQHQVCLFTHAQIIF